MNDKLKRVWRMSPREITVRSFEKIAWGGGERLATLWSHQRKLGGGRSADLLRRFHLRPFCFSGVGNGDRTPSLAHEFRTLFPARAAAICVQAEAILAGSIRLFGQERHFPGGRVDWHRDWCTGARFPRTFYRDIPYQALPDADDKRIWELNRQQFLVTLGQAYVLTGRQEFARRAIELILSWIEDNPPYRGVHWREALEPALRLLSWLWTLRLLTGAAAPSSSEAASILTSLAVQRRHIERHLSTYTSPNTHLLGEALGLFAVGLLFPEIEGAAAGSRRAHRILEDELTRQVAPDGSHREKSTYYHAYALDMYLHASVLGEQHGVSFSAQWWQQVERMADVLLRLLRPDGSLARFGDDDGGCTIRLGHEDYYDPRFLLGLAAVQFGRPDFKWATGSLPEEVFWVHGSDGVRRFKLLAADPPASRSACLRDAGLAVLCVDTESGTVWIACHADPMGFLSGGHSHVAPLTFELAMDGKPVVVDPGTYSYSKHGPWRDYFRSTRAHNSFEIDDQPWCRPAGPFSWKGCGALRMELQVEPEAGLLLSSVGFDRVAGVESFQRMFRITQGGAVLVVQRLEGRGAHTVTFWLQFPAGARVVAETEATFLIKLAGAAVRLRLEGFVEPDCRVFEASEKPLAGWNAPHYGQRCPAPSLSMEERMTLPAERTLRFELDTAT